MYAGRLRELLYLTCMSISKYSYDSRGDGTVSEKLRQLQVIGHSSAYVMPMQTDGQPAESIPYTAFLPTPNSTRNLMLCPKGITIACYVVSAVG
jgi:hypothetical protein